MSLDLKVGATRIDELTGNVYENKGLLWKVRSRSGNVVDNKSSYVRKAGMFLKKQVVIVQVKASDRLNDDNMSLSHPTHQLAADNLRGHPHP